MGKMKKAATFRRTKNFSDCDVSSTIKKTTYKCLDTYADIETHCLSEGHQHRGMFFLVFGYSQLSIFDLIELFSIECRNLQLLWFYLILLSDWPGKLAPSSEPIRCGLVIRVFPRFRLFAFFNFEFSLANNKIQLSNKCDIKNKKRKAHHLQANLHGFFRPKPCHLTTQK